MNSGQCIKHFLKERGLKQCWLAEKLGIKSSVLSSKLNQDVKFELLIEICEILEISIDDIYYFLKNQQKNEISSSPAKTTNLSHPTQLDS